MSEYTRDAENALDGLFGSPAGKRKPSASKTPTTPHVQESNKARGTEKTTERPSQTKSPKAATGGTTEKVQTTFLIDKDLHKAMKLAIIEADYSGDKDQNSLSKITNLALRAWLTDRGLL